MKITKTTKIIIAAISVIILTLSLAACSRVPQSEQLIGDWKAANEISGYDFHEGGTVSLTYYDEKLPVIGLKFNGIITGAYETTEEDGKNYFVIKFSILEKNVEKKYEYNVKGDTLTVTDPDDGTVTTYTRFVDANETETDEIVSDEDVIVENNEPVADDKEEQSEIKDTTESESTSETEKAED